MEIRQWLEGLGLKQYAEVFLENDLGLEDLSELTPEELKDDLGISSLGHRKKLLKAIEELASISEEDAAAVINNYPYIIAYPYKLLAEEKVWFRKLLYLKDVFLNVLKYIGLVVLMEYFYSSLKNRDLNNLIKDKLFQPHFGHWNHFIREALTILRNEGVDFLVPELPDFYDKVQLNKKAVKFSIETKYTEETGEIRNVIRKLTAIDGLINFRNRYIGHGVTLSDEESRMIFEAYLPLLKHLLDNMDFCSKYPLFRYNDGSIERLMGIESETLAEKERPAAGKSIWIETPDEKELPLLPFIIPPEQYIAGQNGENRLFVYEQHTSRRIVYFSPEQKTGETSGEPVKIFGRLLDEKCKVNEVAAAALSADIISDIFRHSSDDMLKELENEKKIIRGVYKHRSETESELEAFFSSDASVYFLASEAGSGKTNLLAEVYRQRSDKATLFLRASRSGASKMEDELRTILNLKTGEHISDVPVLSSLRIVILIDGLNEHRNPQMYLDSVFDLINKLPGGCLQTVISWRISTPTDLPLVNDEARPLFYHKGNSFAAVLSPLDRAETAELWNSYKAHGSKEFRPLFSLEDVEVRDRIFARSLSNPLLLRMFMKLYNRKKLPAGEQKISLWPEWYAELSKSVPGSASFLKALAGLMYENRSLALDFDSLFDTPEISAIIRQLDINSPYRRLLSAGVLSLFFRSGVLYLSFTIEAAFHYMLSVFLYDKDINDGVKLSDMLEKSGTFPPAIEAASILLVGDAYANKGCMLEQYAASENYSPGVAAAAAALLVELDEPETVIDRLYDIDSEKCIETFLEADLLLAKNLRTELRDRVATRLAEKAESPTLSKKIAGRLLYRYCLISHEAGEYERALEIAEKYIGLCRHNPEFSAAEIGFAEVRMATACRKLMRSKTGDAAALGQSALEHGQNALGLLEKELPGDHPELAGLYDMMMKIHEYRLEWDKAVFFGKKRIEFICENMGIKSALLPSAYNNTAIVLREQGSRKESVEYSRTAMKLIEANLDPNHIEMAYANWTLAYTYGKFGEPESAVECMNKTLAVLGRLLPADHPNIAAAEKGLAEFSVSARNKPGPIPRESSP